MVAFPMRNLKLVSNNPNFLDNRLPGDVIEIIKDRALKAMGKNDFTKGFSIGAKVIRLYGKDDQGATDFNKTVENGRLFIAVKAVNGRSQLSTNSVLVMESFDNETLADNELNKQLEATEGEDHTSRLINFVNTRLFTNIGKHERDCNYYLSSLILFMFNEFVKEGYTPDVANIMDHNGRLAFGLAFNKTINEVKRTFVTCVALNHP